MVYRGFIVMESGVNEMIAQIPTDMNERHCLIVATIADKLYERDLISREALLKAFDDHQEVILSNAALKAH